MRTFIAALVTSIVLVVVLGSSAFAQSIVAAPIPDAGVVLVEPFDAGVSAVTVNAAPGSVVTVSPAPAVVPDPVEDAGGALAALIRLYKDGQLTAMFYLLGFFALVYAERKVKWLAQGYRKVAVASLLYGAGMLAERAISGTTPTLSMVVGAVGAAALMAFKAYGAKPTEAAQA